MDRELTVTGAGAEAGLLSALGACHFAGEEDAEEVEEEEEVVDLTGVRSSPRRFLARSFCCHAGMFGFEEALEL